MMIGILMELELKKCIMKYFKKILFYIVLNRYFFQFMSCLLACFQNNILLLVSFNVNMVISKIIYLSC